MNKPASRRRSPAAHPLLSNLLLILLTLLALALAAHLLMRLGTRHGARRTVPDLGGVVLPEAERMARDNDLELIVNDSLHVPAYQGGVVLDQLPERGVEVKPGRKIYVTINSFNQKKVPVPYVAGRSLRQAKNMLEIAGLEIAELVYRPDMATNYVLEEYLDGNPVLAQSRIMAEIGSGITLHVGVSGYGTAVVPSLAGLQLKEAKSRLWELGLNVGEVRFDSGINLLNEKDAAVYEQSAAPGRSTGLGSRVNLRLTLDGKKLDAARAESRAALQAAAAERLRLEEEQADSIARARLEQAASGAVESVEGPEPEEEFFQ